MDVEQSAAAYLSPSLAPDSHDLCAARSLSAARGDVAFYPRRAGRHGDPVLEATCGTGRVTWPLATAGFETVSLDFAGPMLARARVKAAGHPPDVVARIGYGLVPADLDGAIVSSHYFLFEVDGRRLHRWFLNCFAKTPAFLAQATARRSTNYGAIRPGHVLAYDIPLPPLDEQRRLAARVERVAGLVAEHPRTRDATLADLDAACAAAFARLAADAPRRPMAEVAPLVRRPVAIDLEGAYPELGVRSVGRGVFHKGVPKGGDLTWQKPFRIAAGDLVFSNIKAWEGAFAVAGPEDHDRLGSHRYLTCVPVEGVEPRFVWYYLQTPKGLDRVGEASPGSADRNRTLSQKKLMAIEVPCPSGATQRRFVDLLVKAEEARRAMAAADADLAALLPSVLRQAFAGVLAAGAEADGSVDRPSA